MTREEAINKVRWVLMGLVINKDIRDAFEMLIPELRESEDERMMREFNDWLCEEIECRTNDLRDEKDRRTLNMLCYILTKVKTWLEKQKEQNPVDGEKYPESKTFEDEWKDFYNNHLINRQVMSKREIAKHFFWFGQKQIEKPVEWKINGNSIPTENQVVDISPVEWSEEEQTIIEGACSALEIYGHSKLANRLKSLRPPQDRCKDCPHRGDMFLLTQGIKSGRHELAIEFMNYLDENRPYGKMGLSNEECEDIDKVFNECDWAKIMRYVEKYSPQPKQEWSEEDENCRNEMLQYIEQRIGDGTTGQALWKKWYNWLKRL